MVCFTRLSSVNNGVKSVLKFAFDSVNKKLSIEIINNKARHKMINVKYRQMVFQSVGGTVIRSF